MKLRVTKIGDGPGPSELMVQVKTASGDVEQIVIDVRSLTGSFIEVGSPLGRQAGSYLVELPRETVRGAWRVWVLKGELKFEAAA